MIKVLAHAGPVNRALKEGAAVTVYESTEPLGNGESFGIPKLWDHLYDERNDENFLEWGAAKFVRLTSLSDAPSGNDRAMLLYTEDGENMAGELWTGTAEADVPLDSGWIPARGKGFAAAYINSTTPQEQFDFKVEVIGSFSGAVRGNLAGGISGEIDEGGTSQLVLGENPDRSFLFIFNPDTDVDGGEILTVGLGIDAEIDGAGTVTVLPSNGFAMEGNMVHNGPVSINAPVTGTKFTVFEWPRMTYPEPEE